MPSRALAINECYSDNIGDQAISDAMYKLLSDKGFEVDKADYSFREAFKAKGEGKLKPIAKKYSIKSIIPSSFKKIIFIIRKMPNVFKIVNKKYDLAVIGGGQLILSNQTFPLSMLLWVMFLRLRGTTVNIISAGVGDDFSWFDRVIYSISLKQVDNIYLRDERSIRNIKKNFGIDASYCPDIAYYLSNDTTYVREKKVVVSPVEYSVHKRYARELGRECLDKNSYIQFWLGWVTSKILDGYGVHFCPTTSDDRFFSMLIIEQLPPELLTNMFYHEINTWQDFMIHASTAEQVFSGRMHALILGHIVGSDVVPYIVSNKLLSYSNEYLAISAKHHHEKICYEMKSLF